MVVLEGGLFRMSKVSLLTRIPNLWILILTREIFYLYMNYEICKCIINQFLIHDNVYSILYTTCIDGIRNRTPYTPTTKPYTQTPFVFADSEREREPGARLRGDALTTSILQLSMYISVSFCYKSIILFSLQVCSLIIHSFLGTAQPMNPFCIFFLILHSP
jgi:hypothetical protein